MIARIAFEIADIMIPVIAPDIGPAVVPADQFQPQRIGGIGDGFIQISRAQPDIPDINQIYHHFSFARQPGGPPAPNRRAAWLPNRAHNNDHKARFKGQMAFMRVRHRGPKPRISGNSCHKYPANTASKPESMLSEFLILYNLID
jgi:hypothetical protein